MEKRTKKDIVIIMICSALFAALYIIFENSIMEYGKNAEISIWLRFLPVFAIQFGMSCLGIIIVFIKNHESLSTYGVVKKHSILSIIN